MDSFLDVRFYFCPEQPKSPVYAPKWYSASSSAFSLCGKFLELAVHAESLPLGYVQGHKAAFPGFDAFCAVSICENAERYNVLLAQHELHCIRQFRDIKRTRLHLPKHYRANLLLVRKVLVNPNAG